MYQLTRTLWLGFIFIINFVTSIYFESLRRPFPAFAKYKREHFVTTAISWLKKKNCNGSDPPRRRRRRAGARARARGEIYIFIFPISILKFVFIRGGSGAVPPTWKRQIQRYRIRDIEKNMRARYRRSRALVRRVYLHARWIFSSKNITKGNARFLCAKCER